MNVDGLVNSLQATLGRLGQSLVIQGDNRFSDSLTLGQVLKGKVLMHYEGTRYGVSFAGEEKVVDSAVPLRTGEIIYGRVVALGEKVQLQRQAAPEAASAGGADASTALRDRAGLDPHTNAVAQLFGRYQASLTENEHALLMRLLARTDKPDLTALSALVLNKLGMRLTGEAIAGVLRVLEREQPARLRQVADTPRLVVDQGTAGQTQEDILPLAHALQHMLELKHDHRSHDMDLPPNVLPGQVTNGSMEGDANPGSHDDADQSAYLGTWLLNGQMDGSVAHRVATFPLWFGPRLVEVSVALFNQREPSGAEGELRHRRVVLALDTEHLGHVELVVNLVRQNVRVEVRTQNDEITEAMAAHLQSLREQLTDLGWHVDGIRYGTVLPGSGGEVVRSVVEHLVTQDSVNQLV